MSVRRTKILRDLLVNKSRSLLVILAVAVGVAAFGLMITGRIVLEENLHTVYADTQPAQASLSLAPFEADLLEHVQEQDEYDLNKIYEILEKQILPLYYEDKDTWRHIMKNGMDDVQVQFESNRMADEYYQILYK